jgi:hypothetical protein
MAPTSARGQAQPVRMPPGPAPLLILGRYGRKMLFYRDPVAYHSHVYQTHGALASFIAGGTKLLAAPIFIPAEALPLPLRILAYLLPPTYAADALRQALSGTISMSFFVDLAVLLVLTFTGVGVVGRRLRWRVA